MVTYKKRKGLVKGFFPLLFLLIFLGGSVTAWNINNADEDLSSSDHSVDSSPNSVPSIPLEYKIVIDPGHGGKDPGATGASGVYEREYTLSLALQVYELLEEEPMFEPLLIRTEDLFIELEDRAALANEWHADALLSIHANTYTDHTATGTETLYSHDDDSNLLAQTVQQQIVKAMGFRDRGVKKENLKILSLSEMPAVLVEVGYLTNAYEEAFMLSSEGQARAAHAIVEAMKQYFMGSRQ